MQQVGFNPNKIMILNIKETQSNNLNGTIHLPIVAVGIEYIRGKQIAKTAINAPHKLWETENKYENPITVPYTVHKSNDNVQSK